MTPNNFKTSSDILQTKESIWVISPSNELYSKQTQFSRNKHNDRNQIRDSHTHFSKQVLRRVSKNEELHPITVASGLKIEHKPLETPTKARRSASKSESERLRKQNPEP